jgi:hypothetical protein
MSMLKAPVEVDEEVLATGTEVIGTTTKRGVGAVLREAGQRLVRMRIMVKLGEMADRAYSDEVIGTKPRFCSVCRPH